MSSAADTANAPASSATPSVETEGKPGLLERLGLRYFNSLGGRSQEAAQNAHQLPNDETLQRLSKRITAWGATIAFLIGGLTTAGSIWFEEAYEAQMDVYTYWVWQGSLTLVLLAIEFVVLFWVAMVTVHRLGRLAGLSAHTDEPWLPSRDQVPNLLARAALEIPDPKRQILGVDPLRYVSKTKLLAIGLLYRAKIFLSNSIAKFVLRRVLGKAGARISVSWVALPITGAWNAWVLVKVAREARLRLFGYWLAQYVLHEILTDERLGQLSVPAQQAALHAVANAVVFTQNPHPNMLMLLLRLSDAFPADDAADYGNYDAFLALLAQLSSSERALILDLLCVAAAFDGRLSKLEREKLPHAFGVHWPTYEARIIRLRDHLRAGRLHAAIREAQLDTEVG